MHHSQAVYLLAAITDVLIGVPRRFVIDIRAQYELSLK